MNEAQTSCAKWKAHHPSLRPSLRQVILQEERDDWDDGARGSMADQNHEGDRISERHNQVSPLRRAASTPRQPTVHLHREPSTAPLLSALQPARITVTVRAPTQSRTGQMAEWSNAHAWKACVLEIAPRVRIPLCPPVFLGSVGVAQGVVRRPFSTLLGRIPAMTSCFLPVALTAARKSSMTHALPCCQIGQP